MGAGLKVSECFILVWGSVEPAGSSLVLNTTTASFIPAHVCMEWERSKTDERTLMCWLTS